MHPAQRLCIAFTVALQLGTAAAQQCQRPSAPDIGGDRYKALQKRAAYAAFMSDECGFESDVQKKYYSLVKLAFDDSIENQQRNMDDFKSRKKQFSDGASFIGVKKRCLLEKGKTRSLVNEAGDDISNYMDTVISLRQRHSEEMADWNNCVAKQKAAADAEAYRQSEEFARKKAVEDIEAGFRGSFAKEGTYVLQLRNVSGQTADFQLRCYQTNGNYKTFPIALSPGGSTEIGYLEGWPGNFVSGEYCQGVYKGEALWRVTKQ